MAGAAEPAVTLRAARRRDRHRARAGARRIEPTTAPRGRPTTSPRWPRAGGPTSSASCCGSRRGCRSCSSPGASTAPSCSAASPSGDGRRIRRAARDARAEARPGAAAGDHRQAARLRRLGRAAGRLHRLGDRERDPDALPADHVPEQRDQRRWNGCCRSSSSRIAWSDIALAALAYRHDVGATVRARAIVEPWTISIAAGRARSYHFQRDGLILAYVAVDGRRR